METKTPQNQEKIPYMSKNDFRNSEYNNLKDWVASVESRWYQIVIGPSIENKSRLISEDLNEAVTIFSRFDDIQGLEIIAGNTKLPENIREIAQMQLGTLTNKFHNTSNMGDRWFPVKGLKQHFGINPVVIDRAYHGGGIQI
ncbi:MAG: hypothetical protein WCX73_01320 [Candidatus Pacearchaeota archaeon]|jgi:hypothetical protein